ncbi:ABC transporter permease [Lihuaxuella thermophila]|uniref:ABC-2 type transport system permease protein n=1 Tax=Lihuaxuella thermophila TaxID=1173111 RepID=A0A1H8GTC5_9BACL|nr:ABC transporter permease [Lihuaxuella thermophila]SEN47292.1 ABC-2 type transport system permease protein [Lihuaxuella thermophila]
MIYWVLIKKSYLLQLQYRIAHLINNLGSLIFGFIYIAIWTGVLTGKEHATPYDIPDMVHYMAFSQCLLWVVAFLTPGLNVQNSVRTGAISIEMARPAAYFSVVISQEIGRIAYNFLYRSFPIGLVFAVTVGFYFPDRWETYLWTLLSILLAVWIGLNFQYLIGISACWTTEVTWAHLTYMTLLFGLGGQLVPVDLLPRILGQITPYLPFACMIYYPVVIYLEKSPSVPVAMIGIQLAWAAVLTGIGGWLTRLARRRLEIQGG